MVSGSRFFAAKHERVHRRFQGGELIPICPATWPAENVRADALLQAFFDQRARAGEMHINHTRIAGRQRFTVAGLQGGTGQYRKRFRYQCPENNFSCSSRSHGARSASVRGMPARILATFSGGCENVCNVALVKADEAGLLLANSRGHGEDLRRAFGLQRP